jgi:hypothetical protein
MIWTGYFARYKIYQQAHLELISIANHGLRGVNPLKAEWLAPGSWIYQWKDAAKHTGENRDLIEYYIKRYTNEKLNHFSPEAVWEQLNNLAGHSDSILLCYEALPDSYDNQGIVVINQLTPETTFCHRHIVSAFLRSGGFECREYIPSLAELRILKRNHKDNESKEDMFT